MAKCEICGKNVAFGIQVSHSPQTFEQNLEAEHQTCESDCGRQSEARLRLHPAACVPARLPALSDAQDDEECKDSLKRESFFLTLFAGRSAKSARRCRAL